MTAALLLVLIAAFVGRPRRAQVLICQAPSVKVQWEIALNRELLNRAIR